MRGIPVPDFTIGSRRVIARQFLLWLLMLAISGTLYGEAYLVRMHGIPDYEGSVEFSAVEGSPFFVRSTLNGDTEFVIRGSLKNLGEGAYEFSYSCPP